MLITGEPSIKQLWRLFDKDSDGALDVRELMGQEMYDAIRRSSLRTAWS